MAQGAGVWLPMYVTRECDKYNSCLLDTSLTPVEQDIILKHMFPLTLQPPRYLESLLVCLVDKGCSLYETAVRRNAYPSLRPLMPSRLRRP